MKQTSKLLLTSLALASVALSAGVAQARTDLSIGIGVPMAEPAPVYAAPEPVYPAPAYVEPTAIYYHGTDVHRHYDWNYWNHAHPGARWHR